eukprot:3403618-Prorocentrum_lima.AAC.1
MAAPADEPRSWSCKAWMLPDEAEAPLPLPNPPSPPSCSAPDEAASATASSWSKSTPEISSSPL